MAAPVLSTLQHVTDRKLKKLATHRSKFEADKATILAKVSESSDQRAKVQALLDGFEKYGIKARTSGLSIPNLELFMHQAKHDSSVSVSLLRDWQTKLEHELDIGSTKYEYAALFGELVVEWIKHPNPAASPLTSISSGSDSDSDTNTSGSFDQVGRKEMHEQRQQWEEYAFKTRKVDESKIEAYLNEIFGTTGKAKKIKKSPLENLRDTMKKVMDFKSDSHDTAKGTDGENHRFTVDKLKSCIQGVLQSDLFVGQKRDALVQLQDQPAVLGELVDVLNMDLDGLATWEWDGPVPLHMRRQLNGKYRVYMDEETHQAILLHFIGKIWGVALKTAFVSFYHSGAWQQTPYQSMGKKARQRREYFVPRSTHQASTVRHLRRTAYQENYFMTQLSDNIDDDYRDYYAEEQDDRKSEQETKNSPLATKQSMLRLVTTEMLLNTKVYGEFTVVQSDFKWFGPSLPHATIFTVLKFLGVPAKWLRFFQTFLKAPVIFAQDGPDAEAHARECGIPMSHVLSDVLGEAVLFCLDFAVNKRTEGANIYRFHDDLWFWGQESKCIQAWNAMQEFASVMGLELNEEKTGAALIVADQNTSRPLPAALPQGKIKWGFLVLDPAEGRWVIDRIQVDEHILELRRQLGACRSVMAWVQAWNSYVSRFFSTNFGQPANCLGRQHNDMCIETFEHIQRSLFADAGTANVTEYLRSVLKERFGTDDSVPDAFFYFPVELGGLGLRNPFIGLFLTYKKVFRSAGERIDRAFEAEREQYESLKKRWDEDGHVPSGPPPGFGVLPARGGFRGRARAGGRGGLGIGRGGFNYGPPPPPPPRSLPAEGAGSDTSSDSDEPFMSWEEFAKYREELSWHLHDAYVNLNECPPEERVDGWADTPMGQGRQLGENSPYWFWIYRLYGEDMKTRFGGEDLQLGDRDLLPVGLVDVLRGEKVRWEG